MHSLYKYILFLLFSSSAFFTRAQNVDQALRQWNTKNPIEKIYLHTDRQTFFAGQTIWFKSYFMSGFLPSTRNSTLFVELLNHQSGTIVKKVLPVFNAITYGQLELPDTLSTGTYKLRAYTPLMLNHHKDFIYNTSIQVFSKQKNKQPLQVDDRSLSLQFFPEGGNLVSGVNNNIAFKITRPDGLPANASAEIKNSNGQTVATLSAMHDGMGIFTLTPTLNEVYYATINGQKFMLPAVVPQGVAVHIITSENNIQFKLNIPGNAATAFKPAYYIGQMQHQVLVKKDMGDATTGNIPTHNLPAGIMQLTFFNKDGAPLAERLVFIHNKDYQIPAALITKNITHSARKKNTFSIDFENEIEGNFSVSVTDADYDMPGARAENILSTFLLTSDLPGYIYNPAWYLSNDDDAAKAMDLLMLTHGWRRFQWRQVANNTLPQPIYTDPGYISLSGKVNVKDSKKKFAERDLLIWTTTADSARNLQLVKTDEEGRFTMDSLVFFDKAKILFSDVMGNKSKFITVKLNSDSLYKTYSLPPLPYTPATSFSLGSNLTNKMQSAYFDYSRGQGTLLDNINIEGRKLTQDELENRYMSGLFRGNLNARTINLTGQFIAQYNVFEWLIGRMPGLTIRRGNAFMDDYQVFFRNRPVQLFLDEMRMSDATFISAIPANQIALIKLYPQFIGATGNNAALAIYTKRGDDLATEMETTGDIIDYDGYSIIKEYYSPDYSQPAETGYRDYRLTLHWQPELAIKGNTIPISFYNNDRTKRFKIVAEGVTKDGKLLMVEKIIEPGK